MDEPTETPAETPTPVEPAAAPAEPAYPDRRVDQAGIQQRIAQRQGLPTRRRQTAVTYEYDWKDWCFRGAFFVIGFFVAWVLEGLIRG